MKFIEVSKARKLEFNQPVIVVRSQGETCMGRLTKKEQTTEGTVFSFEIARFYEDAGDAPLIITNVTHVAIPDSV